MEVAFILLSLMAAEGLISIISAVRFFLWSRSYAKQGVLDVGLLVLQMVFYLLCGSAMAVSLHRNWGDSALAMRDAATLLPLTAASFAQLIMFVVMSSTFDREKSS